MYDIEKTIKHFEALQKRYTKQHNENMCERVADALEALKKYKTQEKAQPTVVNDEAFGRRSLI